MIEVGPSRKLEKVFLAGLYGSDTSAWEIEQSMEELASLARAAGATVAGSEVQKRPAPDPGSFFGRGKVEQLAARAQEAGALALVVDQDLTPAQIRNLEESLGIKVIDRTEVILDIFAARAHTREAKLQVELAQYEYLLPRLTRMWSHLSRTGGGIGTRGPGETQLETDRRTVRTRISALKRQLLSVERHRHLIRERRRSSFRVSLVGYTNAGKSTIMNRLTRSALPAADQPFMTLDPTTRRLHLGPGLAALLTDTVGFVDRLPHHLVAAFHSTLEEVAEADLLLVIVDAAAPGVDRRVNVVTATLEEIGAAHVDRITVLNKIDRVREGIRPLEERYGPNALAVSARTGTGIPALVDLVRARAASMAQPAASPPTAAV
ncbi:MAG: GTPase HflX [Candidatus Eisenbacteria bacterium]|jgi:GTP-binding protein HflX|nr:GTPase HflX [Candidatus Eisenbacteria bacterium]